MDYQKICQQVIELCSEVGKFIKSESQRFDAAKVEYKGLNDLVSYVDKEAESRILNRLKAIFPEAKLIGEESESYDHHFFKQDDYFWIVDPLDGTTNFIHGVPTFAISIALYKGNRGLIGVVYEINREEMFSAFLGSPVVLNGKEVNVSPCSQISDGLLATGFPYYDFELQEAYMKLLAEALKSCHGVRRIGAAAVDLAYVACGRFEAFFEYNLKPWDIAAGAFLVQQAGGKCCDFAGDSNFFKQNSIVASNGLVQDEMLQMIIKYFKNN